ncbi:MAG: autotransporter-associated beta strand repeat-containing protein, partial [bacterium]|nr:autotransporter-associated beta strand repeat-containing protein [bacterium]
LRITKTTSLGVFPTVARLTTVSSGATLALDTDGGAAINLVANKTLTLTGTGDTALPARMGLSLPISGALVNLRGTNSVAGAITLAGATQIASLKAGDKLTLSNNVTAASLALTIDGPGDTQLGGVLALGGGALNKNGAGTLTLTGTNTYTGVTTVNAGTLILSGPKGAIKGNGTAAAVTLNGGMLVLDNSVSNNLDRVTAAASGVTFNGGTLRFLGLNGATSSESLGQASIALGSSTIDVVNGTGASSKSDVTFSSILSTAGATVNFTYGGTGALGAGGDCPRVFLTGVADLAVLPYATVNGTSLAQYTTANGVRALTPTNEFDGAVAQTGTNVAYTASRSAESDTLTASRSVATLTITSPAAGRSTISLGGDGTTNNLTVSGRAILLTGAQDVTITRTGSATGQIVGTNPSIFVDTSRTLTIGAVISGANTLTKAGAGTLTLSGLNTFTGVTTINAGVLSVGTIGAGGAPGNLGAAPAAAANIVLGGGKLRFTGTGTASTDRGFTLTAGTTGTIEIPDGGATLTLGTTTSATTSGALTKTGPGKLVLGIGENWTGLTTISAGTLEYGLANGLSSGPVTVNGGILDIKTFSDTVGLVTLTAGSINGSGGSLTGTAYIMDSATNTSVSAILAGAVPLVKSGTGTLTLSGVNTYTGTTTINGGALNVVSPGSLAAGSAVTVGGSAASGTPTLAGNGTVNGAVLVKAADGGAAGRIAPGNAGAGVLTTGDLILNNTVFLDYNLGAADLAWGAAGNDGVSCSIGTGNLTISPNLTINVTPGTGFGPGKYHLLRYTGTLTDGSASFSG